MVQQQAEAFLVEAEEAPDFVLTDPPRSGLEKMAVARLLEASFSALRPAGRLVVNVGTIEMLSAVYAMLKSLASPVRAHLVNIARGVEQMDALRFESVNPTFLLMVKKV